MSLLFSPYTLSSPQGGLNLNNRIIRGPTWDLYRNYYRMYKREVETAGALSKIRGQDAVADATTVMARGVEPLSYAAGDRGTVSTGPTKRVLSGVAPGAYLGNYKVLTTPTPGFGLDGNAPEIAAGIEALHAPRFQGNDLALGPRTWGAGVSWNVTPAWGPHAETFGHSGWGGAYGSEYQVDKQSKMVLLLSH